MSNLSAEEFLNKKVKVIFEPIITSVLLEKPTEPIPFMIDWFRKISGKNNDNNMEREELLNLRKEVAKLKKKLGEQDEHLCHSEEEDNNNDDEEDQDQFDAMIKIKSMKLANDKKLRESVSAEVYGLYNKKEDFVARVIQKSEMQIKTIKDIISQSFMFNALDEKDLHTVVMAMEETHFKSGDTVIKQNENGDLLYVIKDGKLDCYKTIEGVEKHLKTYTPGEAFGELALLYNAPRAATIIAKSDSLLWALDRETFNNIVKTSAVKRRDMYYNFLKSVEILSSIDDYEISQISDSLKTINFKAGEHIIRQGDVGDNFYIIEEGEAYANKLFDGESVEQFVKEYSTGSYFGELALIKNDVRAASVIAKTDCKLVYIDRATFKRLLGPVENILKRLSSNYVKYINT